jgi:two-component system, OmpR family, osmolarity sensor histidine kinase EnvZ
MKLLPRSGFGQTVFLVGFLLLINQIVTYYSVAQYIIEPSYQQINNLLAKQVKVIFIPESGNIQIDSELSKKYLEATDIQILNQSPSSLEERQMFEFLTAMNCTFGYVHHKPIIYG